MHTEALQRITFGQVARPVGIRLNAATPDVRKRLLERLEHLGLARQVRHTLHDGQLDAVLDAKAAAELTPSFDTVSLARRLELDAAGKRDDQEREILIALLASPLRFDYPSASEFSAAVRVRMNIIDAARKTQLAFDTEAAERPWDYWAYDEARGFTVRPGKSLIDALKKATQPETPNQKYAFSCYRATEYVLLLGIAQELAANHPALLERLQKQWETRAIMSGRFHDTFLHEFGSLEAPLPPGYYIPGDRLWFRNPDARSADIPGYEGSWVFYLGSGLFSNFWQNDHHYTLAAKCLEIYHWRDGAVSGGERGDLHMDEEIVGARVQESMSSRSSVQRILERMLRLRDGRGIYANGGCIDASRECARPLCPGTADIRLPLH